MDEICYLIFFGIERICMPLLLVLFRSSDMSVIDYYLLILLGKNKQKVREINILDILKILYNV